MKAKSDEKECKKSEKHEYVFWNNEVNSMEDSQEQETKNREREEEKKKRRNRKIRKFPRNSLKKKTTYSSKRRGNEKIDTIIQIFKTFSTINVSENKGQKERIEKNSLSKKKIFLVFNKVEKTNGDATGEKSTKDQSQPEGRTNGTKKCAPKRKRKTGQKEQSENVEKSRWNKRR